MGNQVNTKQRTKKTNAVAFVEKSYSFPKIVGSSYCEPSPVFYLQVF